MVIIITSLRKICCGPSVDMAYSKECILSFLNALYTKRLPFLLKKMNIFFRNRYSIFIQLQDRVFFFQNEVKDLDPSCTMSLYL